MVMMVVVRASGVTRGHGAWLAFWLLLAAQRAPEGVIIATRRLPRAMSESTAGSFSGKGMGRGARVVRSAVPPTDLSRNLEDLFEERQRRSKALVEVDLAIAAEELKLQHARNITLKGSIFNAVDYNYGYVSKSTGVYFDNEASVGEFGPPANVFRVGVKNFFKELGELSKQWKEFRGEEDASEGQRSQGSVNGMRDSTGSEDVTKYRELLGQLVLSNKLVHEREMAREQVPAPLIIKLPYYFLCWVIDTVFKDRPLARFWFLETVARMPYFSYISMLHLYETLGWWRKSAEIKKIHFAEEWNEFHHLLIMESLGGDQLWSDRFFAQHAAVVYYWVLVGLWLLSPSISYRFSQLIESHAVDTYGEFVDANEEVLKQLPPPTVAVRYYTGGDLYFDEFQTSRPRGSRRPTANNLHDVFSNIRDDEMEHVATMRQCQDPDVALRSSSTETVLIGSSVLAAAIFAYTSRMQGAVEEGGGVLSEFDLANLVETLLKLF